MDLSNILGSRRASTGFEKRDVLSINTTERIRAISRGLSLFARAISPSFYGKSVCANCWIRWSALRARALRDPSKVRSKHFKKQAKAVDCTIEY